MNMAFVTGSRAYGIPREDSDIDLVVKVSHDDLVLLSKFGGKPSWNPSNVTANLRWGNLNIIAISSDTVYEAWRIMTEELVKRKPVERDEAKEEFIKSVGSIIAAMYGEQANAKKEPAE